VTVGNALHGLRTEVIGRSQASDDIVVKRATGVFSTAWSVPWTVSLR
jgi:hypothetical protein